MCWGEGYRSDRKIDARNDSAEFNDKPEWEAQASQMARSGGPVRTGARLNDALQNRILRPAFSPPAKASGGQAGDERQTPNAAEKNDL